MQQLVTTKITPERVLSKNSRQLSLKEFAKSGKL